MAYKFTKIGKKFRELALAYGDYKKGYLSLAFEDAVKTWIKNNSHPSLKKNSKKQSRRRSK